jgi:hypothetical protein
MADDGRV